MEWGGIWAYNSGSGSYYAGGKLRSAQTLAGAVTVKIPAQGSVGKKAEEGNLSESEDENLFQIPASGDFSEYE